MYETRVQSLGWEDPLEKGMGTTSSFLTWEIPWIEEPGGNSPQGHQELDMIEQLGMHALAVMPLLVWNDVMKVFYRLENNKMEGRMIINLFPRKYLRQGLCHVYLANKTLLPVLK